MEGTVETKIKIHDPELFLKSLETIEEFVNKNKNIMNEYQLFRFGYLLGSLDQVKVSIYHSLKRTFE